MATRKQYIEAKYVHKKFVGEGEPPTIEAYLASLAANPQPVAPAAPAPSQPPTPAPAPAPAPEPQPTYSAPPAPPMTDLLGLTADAEFEDFKGVSHLSTASSAQASVAGTSTSAFQLEDDDWGDFAASSAAPSASASTVNAQRTAQPAPPAAKDPFGDLLGGDFSGSAFGAPAEDPLASLMMSLTVDPAMQQPAPQPVFSASAFPEHKPTGSVDAASTAGSAKADPFADLLGTGN